MIFNYFNCNIDDLEGLLNDHANAGFKLEQIQIMGTLAHVVMSCDPIIEEPKRVYKKVKNGNL